MTENGEKMGLCNVKLHGYVFFYCCEAFDSYRLSCIVRIASRKMMEKVTVYAGNQFLTIKMSMGFQHLTTFLRCVVVFFSPFVCCKSARDFRIAHSLTSVSCQVEGKSQGQPFS